VSAQSQPVVIVGAGVSGLCSALHLQERGFRVLLLEADPDAGGRVRTDRADGFLLDRGFQVLLTVYPDARDMLDLDALRLGSFAPGAMVRTGSRFARIVDPFRRSGDALLTLFSGVATPLDALRIARMRRRAGRGAPQDLLGGSSHTTLDALRAEGFSKRVIEGFFRPFLGGVLLDRELRGSSRALDFLFRMFAEGDAALPAQGMGAIPSQLVARLAPGTLRIRTRVARLDRSGVTLESGERIDARALPPDDETLEAAVRRQLTNWFGPEISSWRLLRIDRIPDALPFQPPGSFEPARRRTQLSDRLFICGDHRDLASLQGAMASGRRAAMEVAEGLG